jgi:hypothetical protein
MFKRRNLLKNKNPLFQALEDVENSAGVFTVYPTKGVGRYLLLSILISLCMVCKAVSLDVLGILANQQNV